MKFEDHWLDDRELARISSQAPSTAFGIEAIREVWPSKFTELCPSDGYRGMAITLSMLLSQTREGMNFREFDRLIEGVDQSLKASKSLQAPLHRWLRGGAFLEITNAWETLRSGLNPDQFVAALESKLIYTARMFFVARERGV
jgi:hypothetical protein